MHWGRKDRWGQVVGRRLAVIMTCDGGQEGGGRWRVAFGGEKQGAEDRRGCRAGDSLESSIPKGVHTDAWLEQEGAGGCA